MRLNQFIANATGLSRRGADDAIAAGRVTVNGEVATLGARIEPQDTVRLDGEVITQKALQTIILNKPVGYICSTDAQGSKTVYELLPAELAHLKPVGRLDKDSSGLLLMTNDGELAQKLAHPSSQKQKIYEVALDQPLTLHDQKVLTSSGVKLDDGQSTFDELRELEKDDGRKWTVIMHEGRNRQIRRTFAKLGYTVIKLHRTRFGAYDISETTEGSYRLLETPQRAAN